MAEGEHDLEISRLFKVSRERVWRAWSDPELLKQWWCPKPWVTEVLAFEFYPGGNFHTRMTGPNPDGTQGVSDNPGCFVEVVPMERIVGTNMLVGGYRPQFPWLPLTSVFTMADEGGGTRYVARAMHPDPETSKKHEDMGFYHGWGIMLDQLEEFAQGM